MRSCRALATVLAILLASPLASAQQDVIKLAERLNQKAMEDYDALEFDSARQTLLSAIAKLRDAGQDETSTAAKVYMSLGLVYIAGFKDRNRGTQQFVEALKIDGTSQLDPERGTPELQEAFDEAVKKAGPLKRDGGPTSEGGEGKRSPDGVPVVHGLQHISVDEAKPGQDVPIKAQLGSDVSASRLFLFYRGGGQEDYISVPMTLAAGEWVGTIPGEAVSGKTVQYYIEARDSRGRPAVASGSATSPYIISVIAPEPVKAPRSEENPLDTFRKKEPPKLPDRGYGRLFFNLMIGTGFGIERQGNYYEVAFQYSPADKWFTPLKVVQSGGAWSGLHGLLEVGVNITRHISLSLVGRLQGTLLNNADSTDAAASMGGLGPGTGTTKATLAPAGLLRFRYSFLEGRFHPSLHASIGAGFIRHVLNISDAENNPAHPLVDANTAAQYNGGADPYASGQMPKVNEVCAGHHDNCWDNIAVGSLLLGVGASFYYDVAKFRNGGFGLILDVTMLTAVPVAQPSAPDAIPQTFGDQFGINFDVSLGIGAHFL